MTDPRRDIEALTDELPFLLMPVRLETRFKEDELWVRIFPDDCFVDTFDPELTDAELSHARAYWLGVWQAGGVEEQERAAWATLVRSHGPGRAGFIADSYAPANPGDRPVKARPEDLVLTIAVPAPPGDERDLLGSYWRAVQQHGDADDTTRQALDALADAVGTDRAADLVARTRPSNLGVATAADADVTVAFVVLTEVTPRSQAWSAPPRFTTLPDRFVFIGTASSRGIVASAEQVVVVGEPVPPTLLAGPDPGAAADEQLRHDERGNLVLPEDLRWIADFDRAVEVGMGMRVPLPTATAGPGFDRVIVLGIRTGGQGGADLEELLLRHARGRVGLSLVPQGTPTNNTEVSSAGGDATSADDSAAGDSAADASFDARRAATADPVPGLMSKRDGQWLAELLGVTPELFAGVRGADGTDLATGRAMNEAMWPATLGYWMQTMMAPVFPEPVVAQTRDFFCRYVLGAGTVPTLRIGAQPYGILPTTVWSRMRWWELRTARDGVSLAATRSSYLDGLNRVLQAMCKDWTALVPRVPHLGGAELTAGDPQQQLLDVLGLHSGAVQWWQRYAEAAPTLIRRTRAGGIDPVTAALGEAKTAARSLLTRLGYAGQGAPPVLDLVFTGGSNLLGGPVVDDLQLSETAGVRDYTDDHRNYLTWLVDAARAGVDTLYHQTGFTGDEPPRALLYLMLRHALQLGHHEVSVRLHEHSGLWTVERAVRARTDSPSLHLATPGGAEQGVSESRYQPLYAVSPAITGSTTATVGEFIATKLAGIDVGGDPGSVGLGAAAELSEQIGAVAWLADRPTAELERAFADHMDCCAYRLDAWLLGLVTHQLALMRGLHAEGPPNRGLHLGAYAWLEDLRPQGRRLTEAAVPADLVEDFARPGDAPLLADDANHGYLHAPSLNHAVAAAVLRNGYLSSGGGGPADPASPDAFAVNLSSARVRAALALLDGVRAGQSISDLLGYQFERGLHDRHGLAEVDRFIYPLRKAFPLRADRMSSTRTDADVPIDAVEARNVLDGLALAEHLRAGGGAGYPFGRADLPPAGPAETEAITAEARRLLDTHDALADLALAEGVYQAIHGNPDRAAATLGAYSRGAVPPEPEIVRTPRSGVGLTHRVAIHLSPGDPTESPVDGVAPTPRAMAEPAANAWLAAVLPPMREIGCVATVHDPAAGGPVAHEITMDELGVQPVDLLSLVRDGIAAGTGIGPGSDATQGGAPGPGPLPASELDDRLRRQLRARIGPRLDAPVVIDLSETRDAPLSLFEVVPLISALGRILTGSRPLAAHDLTRVGDTRADGAASVDPARLDPVAAALGTLRDDLDAFAEALSGLLGDPARRDELLSTVDELVDRLASLLSRAAVAGVPRAGWSFAYDGLRRAVEGMLSVCADLTARWQERLFEFGDAMLRYSALPTATGPEERWRILTQAERAVSTEPLPRPASPAEFSARLQSVSRAAFVARRDDFQTILAAGHARTSGLRAAIRALLPVSKFDVTDVGGALGSVEDSLVRLAADALSIVGAVRATIDARLADPANAPGATPGATRARALLGEDFLILPEFTLDSAAAAEMGAALDDSRSGRPFRHLPDDFPLDTWLHGVARVREPLHAWEEVTLLSEAFGRASPRLDALQLPHRPDEAWFGLEFDGRGPDEERLLYTAHFAGTSATGPRHRGLLLDEWSELIEEETTTTGLAFHYDRPNHEAPQSMLLVTPPHFNVGWRWVDLVDAINETLDLAKLRAVEPSHVEALPYATYLPATLMASQVRQLTIAADLALNNDLRLVRPEG